MKCEKCDAIVVAGDEREYQGQTLCEDCYIDSVSTIKACDPWATHSAQNFEKFAGDTAQLNQNQSDILNILKNDGPMEPTMLLKKLGRNIPLEELKREFATLHHMGKAGAKKQGQNVLWCLS